MLMTDRDVLVMQWVERCRFLTREQVQRLEFGPASTSSCKRRLTLLYHHGYLGRLQLPLPGAYGASRAVYHLDRLGARYLAGLEDAEPGRIRWRRGEDDREELFLAHSLDINDVRVSFTVAARRRGVPLDWWDESTLRRLEVLERFQDASGERVTLLPDAYFTLGAGDAADGFALEVDRATVSERRMRARIRAYGQWAASGAYRRRLPAESLRVLFAITDCRRDRRRLEHLKEWCQEEGGRSLFWFVDRDGLDADVLTAPVWSVAGSEQQCTLPLLADTL
jgi:hypothetical protein